MCCAQSWGRNNIFATQSEISFICFMLLQISWRLWGTKGLQLTSCDRQQPRTFTHLTLHLGKIASSLDPKCFHWETENTPFVQHENLVYLQPLSNEIKYKLKVQMGLGYTYRINTDPYVCKKQQNFTVLEEKPDKENTTNLCVSSLVDIAR